MKKYIDLHTHTTASDGVLLPLELVKKAKRTGLTAMAVTDHDQVGGINEALRAGEVFGIEVVPGIEITSYWDKPDGGKKEFHILGYYIDIENEELLEHTAKVQQSRRERADKMVAALREIGYQIDDLYLEMIAQGSIGRPHLARAVLENEENFAHLEEVFGEHPEVGTFIEKYLIRGKKAYFDKYGLSPQETIELIKRAEGIPVLAHPCFDVAIGNEELIKQFKDWGIIGLEAIAPTNDIEETKEKIPYFKKMAEKYGLLITGGSDYHGIDDIGAGLGILNWGLEIPYQYLEELKKQ
jgi:hypothetical protein